MTLIAFAINQEPARIAKKPARPVFVSKGLLNIKGAPLWNPKTHRLDGGSFVG